MIKQLILSLLICEINYICTTIQSCSNTDPLEFIGNNIEYEYCAEECSFSKMSMLEDESMHHIVRGASEMFGCDVRIKSSHKFVPTFVYTFHILKKNKRTFIETE